MVKKAIYAIMFLLAVCLVSASSEFYISDLEVESGDESDSGLENGELATVIAEPGENVEFTITLRNEFSDDSNIDVEDIRIRISSATLDDFVDEEEDIEVDEDSEDEFTLSADLAGDADEVVHEITINVDGTDTDGDDHSIEWTIQLGVESEDHEVKVGSPTILPREGSCGDIIYVEAYIVNEGTSDEDDAVLAVFSEELGIDDDKRFDIDTEDDTTDKYRRDYVVPDNTAPGTYTIEFRAYYDITILDDVSTTEYTVMDCIIEEEIVETEEEEEISEDEDSSEGSAEVDEETESVVEESSETYKSDVTYKAPKRSPPQNSGIIGIVIAILVVLAVGVVGIYFFLFRK